MKCPKCDNRIIKNFCIKCGALVNEKEILQIKKVNYTSIDPDITLLEKYLGENSHLIINKTTSIYGGIFGVFYILYKKCLTDGLILIFIEMLILFLISKNGDAMTFLKFKMLYLFFFYCFSNPIYINSIKKRLKRIDNVNIDSYKKNSILYVNIGIIIKALIYYLVFIYIN